MLMSLPAVISNTVSQMLLLGFVMADNRRPLAKQPEQGAHRHFQVSAATSAEILPRLAVQNNVRRATLVISVAYYRAGGDAGGGDLLSTNVAAIDDLLTAGAALEDADSYDARNTGMRRRIFQSFRKSNDGQRSEVWDITFLCDFEENESPGVVAA